jgi:hypothetical protein
MPSCGVGTRIAHFKGHGSGLRENCGCSFGCVVSEIRMTILNSRKPNRSQWNSTSRLHLFIRNERAGLFHMCNVIDRSIEALAYYVLILPDQSRFSEQYADIEPAVRNQESWRLRDMLQRALRVATGLLSDSDINVFRGNTG